MVDPLASLDTSVAQVQERFLELESRGGWFRTELGEARAYDYLRVEIFDAVLGQLGLLPHKQPKPDRSALGYLRESHSFAKSILRRDPFRQAPAKTVVIGHPRRQLLASGRYEDPYVDPLLEGPAPALPDALVLERPLMHRHASPPRTDDLARLAYLDALAARACVRRIGQAAPFSAREAEPLLQIAASLSHEFGTSVPVVEFARRKLALRAAQLPVWRSLFQRLRPEVVFVVVSYGNEIPIEACQQLAIPTIELQHGVIAPMHLGYHFPDPDGRKRLFPDWLFTFGDYWNSVAEFPLPSERVRSVGFARFDRDQEAVLQRAPANRDRTVFLSQPAVGDGLSRVAAEFARSASHPVLYKLHPGEHDWRQRYPCLADAPIEVIEREPLYDVLARCSRQVGVYSTALFEGLGFGLRTAVVDLPGSEVMASLIQRGAATQIVNAADLLAWDADAPTGNVELATDAFFRPNAKAGVRTEIDQCVSCVTESCAAPGRGS